MMVEPGVSAAAIRAFSVPITDGSSMKKSHALSRLGADSWNHRSKLVRAPRARNASRCGSRRRRPITSPPGGGISARPKRASRGPATRNEARIRSATSGSTFVSRTSAAQRATTFSSRQSTLTPSPLRSSSIASTSRMRGMLRRTTSSSVRRHAASAGSAAFLLPAGTIVPASG